MLVIGSYVAKVDLHSFISDLAVYKMAALRLVAAPAVFLLCLIFIRPEEQLLVTSVIQAACPVAANTVLFAVQYKQDSALASKTVAVSTVLSIITIPTFTFWPSRMRVLILIKRKRRFKGAASGPAPFPIQGGFLENRKKSL